MVKITKVDDASIIIDNNNGDAVTHAAVFQARATGDIITIEPRIESTVNNFKVAASYEEVEVNGVVYTTASQAVVALNKFIGNFNSGGGAPSPTQDLTEILETLAHSDCTTEERVATLERALIAIGSGLVRFKALQVDDLAVWGANNDVKLGEGAPTLSPDKAGQLYFDRTNKVVYGSFGNSAVSDWKLI